HRVADEQDREQPGEAEGVVEPVRRGQQLGLEKNAAQPDAAEQDEQESGGEQQVSANVDAELRGSSGTDQRGFPAGLRQRWGSAHAPNVAPPAAPATSRRAQQVDNSPLWSTLTADVWTGAPAADARRRGSRFVGPKAGGAPLRRARPRAL